MTPTEAIITLNMIPGLGSVRIRRLMEFFGSADVILSASEDMLCRITGIGQTLARNIAAWRSLTNPAKEIDAAAAAGVTITTLFDESYPAPLRRLNDPPVVLYSRGDWREDDFDAAVAVVGTRRVSPYGRLITRKFTEAMALRGHTIISGLANGVDTIAHRTALECAGRTLAVIGSGFNRLYPPENADLAVAICEGHGAVISEFPMDLAPSTSTFPMRNRIVSGLSRAVLVTEAPGKSGALITARFAAEQGKLVFAIPGNADRHDSDGCHDLIRDGATLVYAPEQVMDELQGPAMAARQPVEALPLFRASVPANKRDLPPVSSDEQALLDQIRLGSTTIDGLCTALGQPAYVITGMLAKLQITGHVKPQPGGDFALT